MSYSLQKYQMDDSDRNKILAAVNVLENYAGEPVMDWARTLLMQIGQGMFGSDSSSVVSFQSNPDLKGISLFGDLLSAIINKKVLKLTYAPFGKDSFTDRIYPYYLKQFNDRWYLIAQAVGYDTFCLTGDRFLSARKRRVYLTGTCPLSEAVWIRGRVFDPAGADQKTVPMIRDFLLN